MIKRPLNPQFRAAVLSDVKTTTIRENPWPVGVPIMLYCWSGKAYRSKQVDVAAVKVRGFWWMIITHNTDGKMFYDCGKESPPPLYVSEGFASQAAMDDWFRPLVPRGTGIRQALMNFRRV